MPSASDDYYTTSFIRFNRHSVGLLHSPVRVAAEASVGLVISHPNSDYRNHIGSGELAKRGFRVLCVNGRYVNTRREDLIWEQVPLDIQPAVEYLRSLAGVRTVILVGHSGGGQLMPFYQNLAENGAAAAQKPGRFAQGGDALSGLPPADGLVLLDPHHGYGANTLTSLDPALRDEANPAAIDPALDMFDPANGYDTIRPSYSPDFLAAYFRAQAERMNRLNTRALERLDAIASGTGPECHPK
jgi:pimeloyl-ACP methyl ester carboxylesterase